MYNVDLYVSDREISRSDYKLIQNNRAEDTITAWLDDQWDGCEVSVIFSRTDLGLTFELPIANERTCTIPWELLTEPGDISITFVGTKDTQRIVTQYSAATLTVEQSGAISGIEPSSPTLDMVEQLVQDARKATADATAAAKSVNDALGKVDTATKAANSATNAANDAAGKANSAAASASSASTRANNAAQAAEDAKKTVDAAMEAYITETGTEIAYAVSNSGTMPPSDGWKSVPIECPPRSWLWTRTTIHYNKGQDTVSYSVAYEGADGSDGVNTPINTLTYLYSDESGDLWALYNDQDNPPEYEYNQESGDLYAVFEY